MVAAEWAAFCTASHGTGAAVRGTWDVVKVLIPSLLRQRSHKSRVIRS
jgi:hypothetical protein